MGSKGGGDGGETIVRYAPYLEAAHSRILDHEGADYPSISFIDAFNDAVNASPYGSYEVIDSDEGYLGVRSDDPSLTYELKNFPSLWDMFGKFMAGLDLHDLWADVYEDVLRGPEIENAISAHADSVQAEVDRLIMPRFLGGMRDINAVQSTAFVVGKALIQEGVVREVNKFSADLRVEALKISNQQWTQHLSWSQSVIQVYAEMFKLYFATRLDLDRTALEYQSKDAMWNVNLFEHARGIIGAMSGAAATADPNEPSQAQKSIGGALTGASAGWMVSGGNPVGAVIGGVIGLAASFL